MNRLKVAKARSAFYYIVSNVFRKIDFVFSSGVKRPILARPTTRRSRKNERRRQNSPSTKNRQTRLSGQKIAIKKVGLVKCARIGLFTLLLISTLKRGVHLSINLLKLQLVPYKLASAFCSFSAFKNRSRQGK